jgi:hypothetical protein
MLPLHFGPRFFDKNLKHGGGGNLIVQPLFM